MQSEVNGNTWTQTPECKTNCTERQYPRTHSVFHLLLFFTALLLKTTPTLKVMTQLKHRKCKWNLLWQNENDHYKVGSEQPIQASAATQLRSSCLSMHVATQRDPVAHPHEGASLQSSWVLPFIFSIFSLQERNFAKPWGLIIVTSKITSFETVLMK